MTYTFTLTVTAVQLVAVAVFLYMLVMLLTYRRLKRGGHGDTMSLFWSSVWPAYWVLVALVVTIGAGVQ